jgi:hypothetical protein
MSWWKVPDSIDDLTGDGPADAVDEALLGLAEARSRAGEDKPSLPDLLSALSAALSARRDHIDGLPARFRVSARDGTEAAGAVQADLGDAAGRALDGIIAEFRQDRKRLPRPREILYTFTFALGGQPESLLRGPLPKTIVLELD